MLRASNIWKLLNANGLFQT